MKRFLFVGLSVLSCVGVSSAHADEAKLELGAIYRSAHASSVSVQALGPVIWKFKPGIEFGQKQFQTQTKEGEPILQDAKEVALVFAGREKLSDVFTSNATAIVGVSQGVSGRRAGDAETTSRTENITFLDFRLGIGTSPVDSNFVSEWGVSLRNNFGFDELLINGVTPISANEPGAYVKVGYRF